MRVCRDLDAFLDGRLDQEARARFEKHLESCSTCRERVDRWRRIEEGLQAWAGGLEPPRASAAKAAFLVARARQRRDGRKAASAAPLRLSRPLWAGVALALVLLVSLYLVVRRPWSTQGKPGRPAGGTKVVWQSLHAGRVWRFGPVGLALGRGGQARVTRRDDALVVDLASGMLVAWVGHAGPEKGKAPKLQVRAGGYEIQDVGTRFSVAVQPHRKVVVALLDGRVVVAEKGHRKTGMGPAGNGSGPAGHGRRRRPRGRRPGFRQGVWSLEAGQTLEISYGAANPSQPGGSELASSGSARVRIRILSDKERKQILRWSRNEIRAERKAVVPGVSDQGLEPRPGRDAGVSRAPRKAGKAVARDAARESRRRGSYDAKQVRALILRGRHDEAARLLTTRLGQRPDDGRAWSMLGDCRRKQGRWKEAVQAYRKATSISGGALRQRARYLAAATLQDRLGRCREAIRFLDAFLADGGGTLRPEALVRKARCLARMGRRGEARTILRQVEREHAGTTAAVRARRLIERLDGARSVPRR